MDKSIVVTVPHDLGADAAKSRVAKEIERLRTDYPVSYTHLDVYKRQAQGFRRGIAAIGDAYFAFDAGTAVERLAAMFVGQFQMAETAGAKVIDAVHAPIRSATTRLADAASIRDP